MVKNETQQMNGELATALGLNDSNLSASGRSSVTNSPQSVVKMSGMNRSGSKSKSPPASQLQQQPFHHQHQTSQCVSLGNDIRPRPKRKSSSEHQSPLNSPKNADRLIDTGEPDGPSHYSSEKRIPGHRPPWQGLDSPSESVNLSEPVATSSKKPLDQPDSFWCSFRPLEPEPMISSPLKSSSSSAAAAGCLNNIQGPQAHAASSFQCGSSRQTAI